MIFVGQQVVDVSSVKTSNLQRIQVLSDVIVAFGIEIEWLLLGFLKVFFDNQCTHQLEREVVQQEASSTKGGYIVTSSSKPDNKNCLGGAEATRLVCSSRRIRNFQAAAALRLEKRSQTIFQTVAVLRSVLIKCASKCHRTRAFVPDA